MDMAWGTLEQPDKLLRRNDWPGRWEWRAVDIVHLDFSENFDTVFRNISTEKMKDGLDEENETDWKWDEQQDSKKCYQLYKSIWRTLAHSVP